MTPAALEFLTGVITGIGASVGTILIGWSAAVLMSRQRNRP